MSNPSNEEAGTTLSSGPLTLGEFFTWLGFGADSHCPEWPPDTFAVAASLLLRSGAYKQVIEGCLCESPAEWSKKTQDVGIDYRRKWESHALPGELVEAWSRIRDFRNSRVEDIANNSELCRALLFLAAASDEASFDFGLPVASTRFGHHGQKLLIQTGRDGTCSVSNLHVSRVRVLPKMHTPQNGLTIRSLSHNLALCLADELRATWTTAPDNVNDDAELNLLLIPWPFKVQPEQSSAVSSVRGRIKLPDKYGFFEYNPDVGCDDLASLVRDLLKRCEDDGHRVSGVVLPECAITESHYEEIRDLVLEHPAFLVTGVAESRTKEGSNCVHLDVPYVTQGGYVPLLQSKHHRWKLDGWQIKKYGIEARLDPEKLWWEHVSISERSVNFVALRSWLTMLVLICEDLARPDPIGDIVRAVGPNLVICVLMDGPQLETRWSARYAAALADDPGSSVLTLTSLGMATLCPAASPVAASEVAVGLWRDSNGLATVLRMPMNAKGLLLRLKNNQREEWTADGRGDSGVTGSPELIETITLTSA